MSGIAFHSETAVATNGALVEVATLVLDGKGYDATGSIIDEVGGILVGYPTRAVRLGTDVCFVLQTWAGEPIAPLSVTGYSHGFHGAKLTCWALELNGRRYHGRNGGEGMVLTLRAKGAK